MKATLSAWRHYLQKMQPSKLYLIIIGSLLVFTMAGCIGEQIIPSKDHRFYANNVVDHKDISSPFQSRISNATGPTYYPSKAGHADVCLGSGWIIVDMGEGEEIVDGPGPDLRVYESDKHYDPDWRPDLYRVYVSSDKVQWKDLGYGRGIKSFDINRSGLTTARYVKIKGFVETTGRSAGPDIDAVEALNMAVDQNGPYIDKMSLKEAKQVTVSMSDIPFIPPPRSINDILDMLNQPGEFYDSITSKIREKADASPPKTNNAAILSTFYLERGINAREMGRYQQQLEDLRTALEYAEKAGSSDKRKVMYNAGVAEFLAGNFQRGIELYKQSIEERPSAFTFYTLAVSYYQVGDYNAAKEATNAGLAFANKYLPKARGEQDQNYFKIAKGMLVANLLEHNGSYSEAELLRRSYLELMRNSYYIKKYPFVYLVHRGARLPKNLANQGRLVDAELDPEVL